MEPNASRGYRMMGVRERKRGREGERRREGGEKREKYFQVKERGFQMREEWVMLPALSVYPRLESH